MFLTQSHDWMKLIWVVRLVSFSPHATPFLVTKHETPHPFRWHRFVNTGLWLVNGIDILNAKAPGGWSYFLYHKLKWLTLLIFWVWLMSVSFETSGKCASHVTLLFLRHLVIAALPVAKRRNIQTNIIPHFEAVNSVYGLMVQLHTLLNWSHWWQTRWVMILVLIYVIWPKYRCHSYLSPSCSCHTTQCPRCKLFIIFI